MPNIIETRTAKIWWDKDGFSREKLLEGADMDVEDVQENVKIRLQLSPGTPHPALIDIRGMHGITKEAREYGTDKLMTDSTTALALVIDNLSERLIGNFFMSFTRPPYPTRLFTSDKEAAKWLKNSK